MPLEASNMEASEACAVSYRVRRNQCARGLAGVATPRRARFLLLSGMQT